MLLGLGPAKVAIGILRRKIARGFWVMMMMMIIIMIMENENTSETTNQQSVGLLTSRYLCDQNCKKIPENNDQNVIVMTIAIIL